MNKDKVRALHNYLVPSEVGTSLAILWHPFNIIVTKGSMRLTLTELNPNYTFDLHFLKIHLTRQYSTASVPESSLCFFLSGFTTKILCAFIVHSKRAKYPACYHHPTRHHNVTKREACRSVTASLELRTRR